MPRCQRTFLRLGAGEIQTDTREHRWVCPYCADAEIYETISAPDLREYLANSMAMCITDFGPPSDAARSIQLISGLQPECVQEPGERRYNLYLQRGSNPFQLRLQIGHEAFHRVCSQGRIFHWTHEMFACLVSVRLLYRSGVTDYAKEMEREYVTQAEFLPVAAMLRADLSTPPYPQGLYGRAFVMGQELESVVGWPALCRLARCLNRAGSPDIERWIGRFPASVGLSIREIFTATN